MLKRINKRLILPLSVVALLLAASAGSAAYGTWQECQQLGIGVQQAQAVLTKRQKFASEHADYANYQKQQAAKLAKLQTQAEQLQLNNALQGLQKQAHAQRVQIVALQAGQCRREQGKMLALQQLKIVVAGDFFALLRWLRQTERAGCTVKELHLQQAADKLTMELNVELHVTN